MLFIKIGTFTSKNSNWAKTWTSTASAPKLVVDAGANNMSIANSNATRIQAFRGTTEPQSYTISAGADYAIAAYSFDFVMSGTTAITLTDAAATAEACYDLGGRAIQQPQKGQVYIKGGKKHVE